MYNFYIKMRSFIVLIKKEFLMFCIFYVSFFSLKKVDLVATINKFKEKPEPHYKIIFAALNPFAAISLLQQTNQNIEAGNLLRLVTNFTYDCFLKEIPFSRIQTIALEIHGWELTDKALCQMANVVIEKTCDVSLNEAQNLISKFSKLNDISDFVFQLPQLVKHFVPVAFPDLVNIVKNQNQTNLPDLPLQKETPGLLKEITMFCNDNWILISIVTGIGICSIIYYKYYYIPVQEHMIINVEETPEVLCCIYEPFNFISNFMLLLISMFSLVLLIYFYFGYCNKNLKKDLKCYLSKEFFTFDNKIIPKNYKNKKNETTL